MIQKHCNDMQPGMITEFDGSPFPSTLVPMHNYSELKPLKCQC